MAKKRVLVTGEASWLKTGFAKFNRYVLEALHATGKYELAEMGSYGNDNDPQAKSLPWKFYGVTPTNQQELEVYRAGGNKQAESANAFGAYKFDGVALDFQPDIVFDLRDPWMFAHIANSKLRQNFRLFVVPTVDSAPQRKEWLEMFNKCDVITTYSRYGQKVLSADGITVSGVTSPGVDLDLFRPLNREVVRDKHCIFPDVLIFGTVMRNQRRKLFPDLFAAYAAFRNKYRKGNPKAKDAHVKIAQKSALLCHTSWPDVGWDLPDLLWRMGIQRHVIFTYKCDACKNIFTSWFIPCDNKGMALCRICGKHQAHMPNTHNGVSEEELVEIYNLMDIYLHPAICEGWGLPVPESKACGVPGLYQNYSALEDHVENGGGLEIPVGRFYHESETGAIRSLPDLDKMVEQMGKLAFDSSKRALMGLQARNCAEKMHNWKITTDKIESLIDGIQILDRSKTWDRAPNISSINPARPSPRLTDEQFVYWCYVNILSRRPDEKGFNDWLNSLKNGTPREQVEGFFRGEIQQSNMLEAERFRKSMELRGLDVEEEEQQIVQGLNGVLL
jgi:glycosyltransferase involved in cell wall biosynthesis